MSLALLALSLAGCAHRHHARPYPAAAVPIPRPVAVGTVALVDEPGKFVLIDSGGLPGIPPGIILKCFTAGLESAELITTQVRKHPFAIADIRSGQPHKGDRVQMFPFDDTPPVVVPPRAAAAVPALP